MSDHLPNEIFQNFEYPKLMYYFEQISAIPRETYHEEKIADYLVNFAKERGLPVYRDAYQNVLIDKDATPGMEDRAPLLLQGHSDMVCQKRPHVAHDFATDPIRLIERDGWLHADGTTLGADDGVALAVMLCILDGGVDVHPPLQCLFTASEEMGMDGADHFDYRRITARSMVNMDSPDDDLIICGSAGGLHSRLTLTAAPTPIAGNIYRISLGGLAGGHSGEDIHRGRANALRLMGRILLILSQKTTLSLISLFGGDKDNVIPREAEAIVSVLDENILKKTIAELEITLRGELFEDDHAFFIHCEACDSSQYPDTLSEEDTARALLLTVGIPCGVLAIEPALKDLVSYSRNLGVIQTVRQDGEIRLSFSFLSRSSSEAQLDLTVAELDLFAKTVGEKFEHSNRYPAWHYDERSTLRDRYVKAYRDVCGEEPKITVIHAGLECGNIKSRVPDMDIISCGPLVKDLHSPDERLQLDSFARFFSVIRRLVTQ